jgi:thioredoxin
MKILRCIFLFVVLFCSVNCSFARQSDEGSNDAMIKSSESVSGEVVVLNKEAFFEKIYNYEKNPEEWVYEGELPCIVDFYADWCAPCKMVDPILKELAKEYEGKIVIYKINTDNERELAAAFGIRSIPTYLFIPAKGNPQTARGAMPRDSFVKVIDEFLLK